MRILAWPGPATAARNPYIGLLYAALQRHHPEIVVEEFRPRRLLRAGDGRVIWHMHWPESVMEAASTPRILLELAAFTTAVRLARLRGHRLVWTMHNLAAHEGRHPRLERWLMRWLTRRLDGAIALTPGGAAAARALYPALEGKPLAVIAHGHYADVYPDLATESAESDRHAGGDRVEASILFVGQIRPYKNVPHLIRTFRQLDSARARLVVAGTPATEQIARELRALAAGDPRVDLHLGWIEPEGMQRFLRVADVVVLPFSSITNSGSALLALSCGRPVLVPDLGAMRELRDTVGPDAVLLYQGALTREHLLAALAQLRASPVDPERLRERVRQRFDWDEIARRTCEFFVGLPASTQTDR